MDKQKQFIIQATYIFILSISVILFLKYVLIWIAPLLIALLFASSLHQLAKRLTNKTQLSYKMLTNLLYLLFILMFITILLLIGVQVYELIKNSLFSLPLLYSDYLQPFILNLNHQFQDRYNHFHPLVADLLSFILNTSHSSLQTLSSNLLSQLTQLAKNIPAFLFNIFLTLMLTYLIAIDYEHLVLQLKQTFPTLTQHAIRIKHIMQTTLNKLIKAHFILMIIIFLFCLIGFSLLKLNNAIPLALLFAGCDLLPFIGVGLLFIPWIIFEFIAGSSSFALALLIQYIIITAIKSILENQLIGNAIGVSPLFLLLSMIIGGKLFGLIGLLALPFVLVILMEYKKK